MLSLKEILDKSLWVIKYDCGYRKVDTYSKCKWFLENDFEEIKDFDVCANQPDELKDFFTPYFKYISNWNNQYMTIEEYYNNIYSKGAN